MHRRHPYLLGAVCLTLLLPVLFMRWLWGLVDQTDDTYNAIMAVIVGPKT